jgi:hypothetical protein
MDPALAFWLRHVAAEGGLWEPAGRADVQALAARPSSSLLTRTPLNSR